MKFFGFYKSKDRAERAGLRTGRFYSVRACHITQQFMLFTGRKRWETK